MPPNPFNIASKASTLPLTVSALPLFASTVCCKVSNAEASAFLPIAAVRVVTAFLSLPNASANSFKVSRVSGAPSTKAATFSST